MSIDTLEARLNELRHDAQLERRLVQWSREYGFGKADSLDFSSTNILQKLHIHAGFMPPAEPVRAPIRTEADKTESIVQGMEANGYWKHAQVLRIDYYLPNNTIDMRLTRLNKIGIKISRSGYYAYLKVAKELVLIRLNKY